MYVRREDDGNVSLLLSPKETWAMSSLGTVGLAFTNDDFEISLLMAIKDMFLVLGDDELVDVVMTDEQEHGHTDTELNELETWFREELSRLRYDTPGGRLD